MTIKPRNILIRIVILLALFGEGHIPSTGALEAASQVRTTMKDLETWRGEQSRLTEETRLVEDELQQLSSEIAALKSRTKDNGGLWLNYRLNRKISRAQKLAAQADDLTITLQENRQRLEQARSQLQAACQTNVQRLRAELEPPTDVPGKKGGVAVEDRRQSVLNQLAYWLRVRAFVEAPAPIAKNYALPEISIETTDGPKEIRAKVNFLQDQEHVLTQDIALLTQRIQELEAERELFKAYDDFMSDLNVYDEANGITTELSAPSFRTGSAPAQENRGNPVERNGGQSRNEAPALSQESNPTGAANAEPPAMNGFALASSSARTHDEIDRELAALKNRLTQLNDNAAALRQRLAQFMRQAEAAGCETAP